MKVKVLNIEGKETGRDIELNDDIFNTEPDNNAIYLDVKHYLANKRQGTNKTKERSEIIGSNRKLRRQKGSGAARVGSIKNPIFRGGGRTFGPKPRSYKFKINKKLKKLARKSALSAKNKEKQIIVIEDFNMEKPKTKEFLDIKDNLNIADKKTLFVFKNKNNNVYLSSRNLQKTRVVTANELNTYNILNCNSLVLSEKTVEFINQILA